MVIQWTTLSNVLLVATAITSAFAAIKSANAARESLLFNKEQIKKQEEEQEYISAIYLERVKKDVKYLHDAVVGQYSSLDVTTLKYAKLIALPSPSEMAKYLPDKKDHITKIFELYNDYYSKYWFKDGEFSTEMYDKYQSNVRQESFRLGSEIMEYINRL
ncbi:hypothetical protein EJP82_01365 [Paenibacillus anaericanus]|uniref:DUF4760 domain-containing protein n=1 Tax=Paenibacillus anaericanus TaxID=170367 RepID=A0A3S1DNR6_9BACL|nr:hypothetical protein [Paenibacillus anaericanus]RUT48618.1 hypothetical protein EJP82_01365 [Paenibacillus anaericanus]